MPLSRLADRQIHWIDTDDGQRLYAESAGRGPAIVFANGLGCSFHYWKYVGPYFSRSHRVVMWDYRGHGRTPNPKSPSEMTIERLADDLAHVLDGLGIDRAVLVGHSLGCQVIFETWRRHGHRVSALVPILGTYGRPMDSFLDLPWFGRAFPAIHRLAMRAVEPIAALNRWLTPGPLSLEFARRTGIVHPTLCRPDDMKGYFEHLAGLDLRVFLGLAAAAAEHSAEDALERVDVPVLVVGGEKDLFTPLRLSEEMHRRIAGSDYLVIPEGSHAALIEQPQLIALRIEKFLRDRLDHPVPKAGGG